MRTSQTWILLCEASRARLFTHDGQGDLTEIMDFAHPGSRSHGLQMATDRPGRRSDGPGPHSSGLSQETEPKEVEAQRFATLLAGVLKQGLNQHRFGELVLAAPPHFLGLMRQALDPQVTATLAATFDKNLLGLSNREIESRIFSLSR